MRSVSTRSTIDFIVAHILQSPDPDTRVVNMEHDALVHGYSHLKSLSREKEALHTLRKIASLVKPIMRARNWTVGILAEFYPDQKNLLGINQNRGEKICLRLRYPSDVNQFLPIEQVVDTMLHELAHNVHGPHNEQFHALWDQERKEYEALLSKGYSGEGFLSNGRQLGGRRIPMHEARRLARAAAEKRATLSSGSGQKLGGRPLRVGTDIRKVIVDAIERRGTVLKGCGSAEKNDDEIEYLATRAVQNGFKTKAEEDEANDRAIAAAVWELIQEDQKNEYGDNYVPSTPANPTGNGGGTVGVSKRIKTEPSSSKPASPSQSLPIPPRQAPKHISRLVGESSSKRSKPEMPKAVQPPDSSSASEMTGWTCEICTLHNPINYLCCDACTTERPPAVTKKLAEASRPKAATAFKPDTQNSTWTCSRCTTIMEDKWWTCNTCGKMKESS